MAYSALRCRARFELLNALLNIDATLGIDRLLRIAECRLPIPFRVGRSELVGDEVRSRRRNWHIGRYHRRKLFLGATLGIAAFHFVKDDRMPVRFTVSLFHKVNPGPAAKSEFSNDIDFVFFVFVQRIIRRHGESHSLRNGIARYLVC